MTRILLSALCLLISMPAYAGSCYSKAEAEAEQGIRIQNELMVIGLTCNSLGKRHGLTPYADYQKFKVANTSVLEKYNNIMLSHFAKSGGGSPDKQLRTLSTSFGNKISEDAAKLRPDVFCSKYLPRITRALEMNSNDFRRWASTFYASHPVTKPMCEG